MSNTYSISAELGSFKLIPGPHGETAYDYAVSQGYKGTETDFARLMAELDGIDDRAVKGANTAAAYAEIAKKAANYASGGVITTGEQAGYINAIDYGLVPDGETDNLAMLNALILEHPDATVYFGNGTFCFSGMIDVTHAYFILDGATFKLTSPVSKYFIRVLGSQDGEFPTENMFIRGNGTIDAGGNAPVALGIGTQKMMLVQGLKIKGFTLTGLEQGIAEMPGYSYELIAKDLLIYNEDILDTTGMYVSGDSTYSDIVILNCKTGIEVTGGGNCFHNIHGWNYDFSGNNKEAILGTVMIKIDADGNRFDQIYFDTYETGATFQWSATTAVFNNVCAYLNMLTVPDSLQKSYMFSAGEAGDSAAFLVSNCTFPSQGGGLIALIDSQSTKSKFYNCMNWSTGESFDTTGGDIQSALTSYVSTLSFGNTVKQLVEAKLSDNNDEIKDYVDQMVTEALGGTAVPCTDLVLSVNSLDMQVEDTYTLTAAKSPSNTTQTVRWSTSSPSVATVVNGLVTAVGGGKCRITAKCGVMSDVCDVSVTHGNYLFELYGYTSDGTGFTAYTGDINLSDMAVEAVADVSGYGSTAGVLSLGLDITQWPGYNIHAYYNPEDGSAWYDVVIADNWEQQAKSSTVTVTDPTSMSMKIDSSGLYIDGTLVFSATDGDVIAAVYGAINESEAVQLGQHQQGAAVYSSITVKNNI